MSKVDYQNKVLPSTKVFSLVCIWAALLYLLRCLVIDEADRMVEKGHFAELQNLLEMLNTSQFNPSRQTFVFSATLTLEHCLPARMQQKKPKSGERNRLQLLMEKVGVKDKPKVIDLTRKQATVETLTETRISCSKDEKDLLLYYFLLQYPGRSMVFANSIDCIKRLSALLLILDCAPLTLHANMHQKQRLRNLERFAEKDRCSYTVWNTSLMCCAISVLVKMIRTLVLSAANNSQVELE